jgi:hypothetical protein
LPRCFVCMLTSSTAAVRGARIGRAGARAGRGGYGNVNGGAKKSDAPIDAWPTTTATTADGWSSQVEQAEAASAHGDEDGWGEPAQPEPKIEEPVAAPEPVKRGAWGKELPKSVQPPKQAAAPVAAAPPPAAAPAAPAAPLAPAAPAPKPKMTWAQIAKCVELTIRANISQAHREAQARTPSPCSQGSRARASCC